MIRSHIFGQTGIRRGFCLVDPFDVHFQSMSLRQQSEIIKANSVLYVACTRGVINEQHYLGRVLDVGCGHGGSTYVLARNTTSVVACDTQERSILEVISSHIVDASLTYHGRAQDYLKKCDAHSIDMITCFGLDPYFVLHPKAMIDLYNNSLRAMGPTGRMIIQSDMRTMARVQHIIPGRFRRFGHETPYEFLAFAKEEFSH